LVDPAKQACHLSAARESPLSPNSTHRAFSKTEVLAQIVAMVLYNLCECIEHGKVAPM